MDIMSHPDVRGSHLFGMTVDHFFNCFCKKNQTEMLYGFPGKYHYDIGIKHLGYMGLPNKVCHLSMATPPFATHKSAGVIFKIERPDFKFDLLWWTTKHHYDFSVKRDTTFIKWRFSDHPDAHYEIWSCRSCC